MEEKMIRCVVALGGDGKWLIMRQTQWMAELRRSGMVKVQNKIHLDLPEEKYLKLINSKQTWENATREYVLDLLVEMGGKQIDGPLGNRGDLTD